MDITFPSLRFDIRIGRLKSIILPWFVADISHRNISLLFFSLASTTLIPRVRHRSLIFPSNSFFFLFFFSFNLYHFFFFSRFRRRRKNPSNKRLHTRIIPLTFGSRKMTIFSNPVVRYAQWRVFRRVFNPVWGKFILVRFEPRDNPSLRIKNAHSNDIQITVRSIKISERTAFLSFEKRKEEKYY